MSQLPLDGKRVLVTGGLGGLGWATALAFLSEGARVAVTDKRTPTDPMSPHHKEHLRGYVEIVSGQILYVQADITWVREVERAVNVVADSFGGIDYLVLTAAVGANLDAEAGRTIVCQSCLEYDEKDFDLVMDINLMGSLRFIKYTVPHMPASIESAIVSVTSEFADGKAPYAVAYTAAKAALSAVGTSLAYDTQILPRRSVVLAPGPINAPMLHTNPKAEEEVRKGTTLGRWAEPEEIAKIITTICEVPALQGTVVKADCGFLMRA